MEFYSEINFVFSISYWFLRIQYLFFFSFTGFQMFLSNEVKNRSDLSHTGAQ